MSEKNSDIEQLNNRMRELLRRQNALNDDMAVLSHDINKLDKIDAIKKTPTVIVDEMIPEKIIPKKEPIIDLKPKKPEVTQPIQQSIKETVKKIKPKTKSDLEKFIGENLISKIGIIILVIGVGIGAKYAIDHDLISPLTRIVIGYFIGGGLLTLALFLKKKYENFSAVILSGAIATFYIITYLAYSLYGLMPQLMAFALMLIFTAFTVVASIHYNKQIIALYGLVGAYAIPFLLSNGSGQMAVFFSYIAIVNIGILVIALTRYWKWLYYVSFAFTWLIFFGFLMSNYQEEKHYNIVLVFSTLFYIIFYATFLLYKLFEHEKFTVIDVVSILINTFVYFFIGYGTLVEHHIGQHFLGAFTIIIAIINFIVSLLIYKRQKADKNLFYFTIGMVLVFLTIAIPIQLDGYMVTVSWAGIATVLFWIGQRNNIDAYKWLSYPIILLSFISLINDWGGYPSYHDEKITPIIFNIQFLSSIFVAIALIIINWLNYKTENKSNALNQVVNIILPSILGIVLFNMFRFEIVNYWNQSVQNTMVQTHNEYVYEVYNYSLITFKQIWIINYGIIFLSVLAFLNLYKLKNKVLSYVNIGLLTISVGVFLFFGLLFMSELRDDYLKPIYPELFNYGKYFITIRYISLPFLALGLYSIYRYIKSDIIPNELTRAFEIVLHTCILWVLSSELIHWMDMSNSNQSYKLGLSILWGLYALFIISFGIWKDRKLLRIIGMSLFGITLIKLFIYDIAHLNTISKVVVFLSLGVLLLIVSFLYTKFKSKINHESD